MAGKAVKGITVKKEDDFSEWYTQLVHKAELADLRYNIKGFVCYLPWSTITIKKMYDKYEHLLEEKGHLPLIMPSLIPEENFKLEAEHVEGFIPQVFWVTEAGDVKLDEKLALRPTSETALYKMYSYWVRSYKDLPFKRYQSCQVWRYEGKSTRPFFRGREFHWIEAHNVFATEEDARNQVLEDMEVTHLMIEEEFAIPIIFFQRPEWDKFPGAIHTYAADALMDSGRVLQLPSTHLLGTNFSKPFNVKFVDKDNKEKLGHITCYGPAISRIYGAMIAKLGDDQGLILPFNLAPVQIVVVPIIFEKSKAQVLKKCQEIEKKFKSDYIVKLDDRDYATPGEKFNEWEMKGVPIRIEVGPKDLENDSVTLVVRHNTKKSSVKIKDLRAHVKKIADSYTADVKKKNLVKFEDEVQNCDTLEEVKEAIKKKKIVRCGFCSLEMDAYACAESIEKDLLISIRGKKFKDEKEKFDKCIVCGKPAKETVYLAKSY